MLTIYCGDNTVESRKHYSSHIAHLKESGYDLQEVESSQMSNLNSIIHGSSSLFAEKKAYALSHVVSRASYRKVLLDIDHSDVEIVMWETTYDPRSIKRYFPSAKILESKLPANIWKMLDSFAPGNAQSIIRMKQSLGDAVDEHMLLYMLQRRAKDLILARNGLDGKRKLAPWQVSQMKSQAARWKSEDHLVRAYHKLSDIEKGVKTGTLPYSADKALDILFSFYLQ